MLYLIGKLKGVMFMILKEITNNVRIKEGYAAIEKYCLLLLCYPNCSVKFLSNQLSLPIPLISAIKNECKKRGLIETNKGISLSKNGEKIIREELGLENLIIERYLEMLDTTKTNQLLLKIPVLNDIFQNRPSADVTLDQSKCEINTALKRVIFMLENEFLLNKKIACIGDDDLISVMFCFILKYIFGGKKHYCYITVFDKDIRIIDYIRKIVDQYCLSITCIVHSLENTIDAKYLAQFDCFTSDPPYTLAGLELFLSRGIELLKRERLLSIFLSYARKTITDLYAMQTYFLQSGLLIHAIERNFNRYEGAQILGGVSDYYHLLTTDKASSSMIGEYHELLYTRQQNPKIRRYRCKSCKKIYKIGENKTYKTIEVLKNQGCPICGKDIFILLRTKKRENE